MKTSSDRIVRGNLWDPVIGFRNQLFCFFPTSMSKNKGNCVGYPSRKFGEKFLRALEENSCFQRTYPLKYCCNFPVFGRINPSKVWISSKAIQKISPTFGEGYPTSFLLFWCIFVGKTIKKWFPKITTSSQIFPLTTANPFSQSYAGRHTHTHSRTHTHTHTHTDTQTDTQTIRHIRQQSCQIRDRFWNRRQSNRLTQRQKKLETK